MNRFVNNYGLKEKILEFKSEVEKLHEKKDDIFKLNCLSLWNAYQTYVLNLLNEFPIYKEKNKINDENVEILEFLRIYDFSVTAKGDFEKQKQLLIDYTNDILKELAI